jgi:hypothetical protein
MNASVITGDAVASTWLQRGIADLYLGFHLDSPCFGDQAMFMQIMALEKHLKAVLLFEERAQFETLPKEQARQKLNEMAKRLSHKFPKMLDSAAAVSKGAIRNVDSTKLGIFEGAALLKSITEGYEETRYPVPRPSWRSFPIVGLENTYHDPLNSSDTDSLIYSICTDCFRYLETRIVDSRYFLVKIAERFGAEESFVRFQRMYLADRWIPIQNINTND